MKRAIKYSMPYGPELDLNRFGDFQLIVMRATEDDGKVEKRWTLESEDGTRVLELKEADIMSALLSLFFMNARGVTISPE